MPVRSSSFQGQSFPFTAMLPGILQRLTLSFTPFMSTHTALQTSKASPSHSRSQSHCNSKRVHANQYPPPSNLSPVFEESLFQYRTYKTAAAAYMPWRWQHGQCQTPVPAVRGASQLPTLFDIDLTTNRIIQRCVPRVGYPKEGTSITGDTNKAFVCKR